MVRQITNILSRAGVTVLTLILAVSSLSIFADQLLPEQIIDQTSTPLDTSATSPVFVYFNYGSPAIGYTVNNVSANVRVENLEGGASSDLRIDENNIYDINLTGVDSLDCRSDKGKLSKINKKFVVDNELIYGPNTGIFEGVDGELAATLTTGQVGCLKVGLLPGEDIKSGELVQTVFEIKNTELTDNTFYKPADVPPVKKILFSLGSVSLECSDSEAVFQNRCVPACSDSEYMDNNGECNTSALQCEDDQQKIGSRCLEVCIEEQYRDSGGSCVDQPKSQSGVVSVVFTTLISIFLLFFIVSFARWAVKTMRR